jgi:hypothetical protein
MINNTELYSAMQEGKPIKSYIKTILGKVHLTVLDPFTDQPMGVLLEGDPRKYERKTILDIWSTKQDVFVHNMNASLFDNGVLIEYKKPTAAPERTIDDYNDTELLEVLGQRFLGLQAKLNKVTNIQTLYKMLSIAEANEKSEKILAAIEARISELQKQD